jgi:hypothetical protein
MWSRSLRTFSLGLHISCATEHFCQCHLEPLSRAGHLEGKIPTVDYNVALYPAFPAGFVEQKRSKM